MPHDKRRRARAEDGGAGPVQRRVAPGRRTLTSRLPPPVQALSENQKGRSARNPTPMVGPGYGSPVPPMEELRKYSAAREQTAQVQREDVGRTELPTASVQARAAEGVAGAGNPLPHRESIQAAFGRHDVANIEAHVGGEASHAAADIGAQAFASGDHVAFTGPPDLHTAAHEAAHVIQQRGGVQLLGGVGRAGDTYEQHADAVADRVVQGQSAEAVLDQVAGDGHAGDQPATETAAAQPSVQRAPPPGPSGEPSPAQDAAVYDHAGKLRQLADTRDPSNPNNTLTAQEMYETWRNVWSSRDAQSKRRLQQLKDRMRSEDPLGYAEKKERFDSGLRGALGPQYEAAEIETALCSAELSSMEEVLNWLEGQETVGRRVTLEQVSRHALEWAHARDKYGSVVMALFLMGLPFAMAGGGSVPPEMAPATDGAAVEGAAVDGLVAEEAAATERRAAEGHPARGSAAEGPALKEAAAGEVAQGENSVHPQEPVASAPEGAATRAAEDRTATKPAHPVPRPAKARGDNATNPNAQVRGRAAIASKEAETDAYLRAQGRTVEANPAEGQAGSGRQGDRIVDGVKTEYKHPQPGADSGVIRNEVNNSIRRGGQARQIIIDARDTGLTQGEAVRGINRAMGIARGKVDVVEVIGDGYHVRN
jgi:hypothetical protein